MPAQVLVQRMADLIGTFQLKRISFGSRFHQSQQFVQRLVSLDFKCSVGAHNVEQIHEKIIGRAQVSLHADFVVKSGEKAYSGARG